MYLYTQPDRNYKLLQNTILCIFSMWREYNSYSVKSFRNYTLPHLEPLYLWRSRHRCFTRLFCSTKQSHLSAEQSCAPVPEGIPAGPFARGSLCLQASPSTQKCSKKLWLHFSGDGDGFTLTSEWIPHSALTLWFAGRAAQQSLQKSFHQHPDFAVHSEVEHWQQETPPHFRFHTSFTSGFV